MKVTLVKYKRGTTEFGILIGEQTECHEFWIDSVYDIECPVCGKKKTDEEVEDV